MYRSQEKSLVNNNSAAGNGDIGDEPEENYQFSGATLKITDENLTGVSQNTSLNNSSILHGSDALSPTPEHPNNVPQTYPQVGPTSSQLHGGTFAKPKVGSPRNFFSFRPGQFEEAIKDCVDIFLRPANDVDILGSWLLTEISHWDHERERVYILTTKTLLEVKYDFIAMRALQHTKTRLTQIDTVIKGKLTYPSSSFVPDRTELGVRIMWNRGQPVPLLTSWNPFAKIPWKTLTDHPLFNYKDPYNSLPPVQDTLDKYQDIYSVERFHESIIQVFNADVDNPFINHNIKFEEQEIIQENYAGVGAVIHNKNNFGFFKVRGKFSF